MGEVRSGWKVLTHEGRSPLRPGPSLLTGPLPLTLPIVSLDSGPEACAAGWHYVADIPTGWRLTGMWPTGYPVRLFAVEAAQDAIERGQKRRASSLTLLREATADELMAAFDVFSRPFGVHRTRMAQEQAAWYQALRRPGQDAGEVEAQLALALSARGLIWQLQHFSTAGAAGAAWDSRAARAAWDSRAAGAAGAVWDAGDAEAVWDAGDAEAAWAVWDAGAAWAAWDAWAAWAALTTYYARLMGWHEGEPEQYTVGIREAHRQGLAVALPVGPRTLGWAMTEEAH